jgi:3-oxoacyl-[acyl-carrier protein] reductase
MKQSKIPLNIVITGTSRGIGKQLAEYYVSKGYIVHGIARSESIIKHENYNHYELDLYETDSINNFFKNFRKTNKNLYGLINNAGVLTSLNSLIMPVSNLEEMINLNIRSNFLMTREAAKLMMKSKIGRIIHIGSMASKLEPSGDSVYAMTKSAVQTLSRIISKEYSTYGITSNNINITYIETDLSKKIDKTAIKKIISNLPIPRKAEFEDIINVINFYLSKESGYITGQDISLGGL